MNDDEATELHRRVRGCMADAEQALDGAIFTLRRLERLSAVDVAMRDEFTSDVELLRGKLATIGAMLA